MESGTSLLQFYYSETCFKDYTYLYPETTSPADNCLCKETISLYRPLFCCPEVAIIDRFHCMVVLSSNILNGCLQSYGYYNIIVLYGYGSMYYGYYRPICMYVLHVNLWAHILPHAPLKITYTYVHVASTGLYCCSQTMPMRFNIDDISKKTKHHATECSRYLVELDKVYTYIGLVFSYFKCLQYYHYGLLISEWLYVLIPVHYCLSQI